jgi:hypothetical protein
MIHQQTPLTTQTKKQNHFLSPNIEYSEICAIRHLSFPTTGKNLWPQSISVI